MQPIESNMGSTVEQHNTRDIYRCLRRGGGVLFALIAFPCTVWSILNWNTNYAHRRHELEALQEAEYTDKLEALLDGKGLLS